MLGFQDDSVFDRFDRDAFKFRHKLLGPPALSLDNLSRVIPALPTERVRYSTSRLANGDDFEATFRCRPGNHSIEETIEGIRTSKSYIMVSGPEIDPSFALLHRDLIADVESLMRRLGVGDRALDSQLYLFIASPGSVTPFHIDRYSTFLLQFRGTKEVSVFPQWDERVVSAADREAYVAYANTKLPWTSERDALGTCHTFEPGEALHIPFVAGHHVRNGDDDVSISMSIIFNSRRSLEWRRALSFNHAARRILGAIGLAPATVGVQPWRDALKSRMWAGASALNSMLR